MHRSGAVMAWNVFRFCTSLRGLGSLMIVLVLAIVGVTYYAVVIVNYGPALLNGGLDSLIAVAVVLLFHALLVMLIWSYFSVVLTDPGSVPLNWRPATMDEESGEATALTSADFSTFVSHVEQPANQDDLGNPRIRYCRKCNQLKPPRCHHCSVCGRCVLKMDHHCVWVVNCVGALNYKYFLLFLAYEKRNSPKSRYNLGQRKNFEQVFGTDRRYWFTPAYSDEDLRRMPVLQGVDYLSKPDLDAQEL